MEMAAFLKLQKQLLQASNFFPAASSPLSAFIEFRRIGVLRECWFRGMSRQI
jgi:hypothetical protein